MKVVFDFGGVVFRWKPLEFLQRMLPRQAGSVSEAKRVADLIFQGFGEGCDWGEFDRGRLDGAEVAERIALRSALSVDDVLRVVDGIPGELAPIEGSVRLIELLHEKRVPLHFLSNMPAPYADALEEQHAFLRCFRSGVYSSRVGMIKPEPAIFALAADRFESAPSELLFIDDVLVNVEAARAAGWNALHFTDPCQCEAELKAASLL